MQSTVITCSAALAVWMLSFGAPAPVHAETGDQAPVVAPDERPELQGDAQIVPKSMHDERRPASSGEDDLDTGQPTASDGRRDTTDADERPLTPDDARPHPREADSLDANAVRPPDEVSHPQEMDVEGRRGPTPPNVNDEELESRGN